MLTQNTKINPISLMPFGAKVAYVHTDINKFTDIISGSINTLLDYAPIGNAKQFYYSASYIDINGLRLAASVSTPSKYTVKNSTGMYLFLPFYGFADAKVDGKSGVSAANNNAFFSPEMARTGVTSDLAMVQASICDVRLAATAKSMVGEKGFKKLKNLITHPSYLPLDQKNHKFDHVFKRLFELIDDHDLDENLLKMLGIDDVFYRTLVLMLIDDDQYMNEIETDAAYSKSGIERVAEFISVNYGEPITLTMLEQISGMTGKSLAKGFKKRFSCSPMQWLYKYRLDSFRQRLELGASNETVTSIAYSCGFTRIGALSVRYFQVFGEKPSETLARSRYL
jgi:AraC-like DNA-binding protein